MGSRRDGRPARMFAPLLPGTYSHATELKRTARHAVQDPMKRVAIWAFYAVGALAIGYLALYAYAVFTARDLRPGDPIHIFRRPDAPEYSWRSLFQQQRRHSEVRGLPRLEG